MFSTYITLNNYLHFNVLAPVVSILSYSHTWIAREFVVPVSHFLI